VTPSSSSPRRRRDHFDRDVSLETAQRFAFHPKTSIRFSNEDRPVADLSYGCDAPLTVHMRGLQDALEVNTVLSRETFYDDLMGIAYRDQYFGRKKKIPPLYVDVLVPCRRCETCLNNRRRMWTARALIEHRRALRTWFCTYTLAPEHRFRVCLLAKKKYGSEDYLSCYKIISQMFTKYLKRVRKVSGSRFRYLLVAEQHKDGFPHLHALIHEIGSPISKRTFQGHWPYGFTNVKLVDRSDTKGAAYVCKYLAKSLLARVRASLRYGAAP